MSPSRARPPDPVPAHAHPGTPRRRGGPFSGPSWLLLFAFSCLGPGGPVACIPDRGGWDVDRLLDEAALSERGPDQRIGDMLPYPVLEADRVGLVACRFPAGRVVSVVGAGPGWMPAWGRAAVDAVSQRIGSTELRLVVGGSGDPGAVPGIRILAGHGDEGGGPRGLGDTLGSCDVSPVPGRPERVRGQMLGAEIRMRRMGWNQAGNPVLSTPGEWVGALM
ncbi:MAG TPA: hypothetical protein ENI85_13150, partial [Deltaproteobacteria bacterium]|nr:hypothetical protein [Deltaproteobacteria bacterium]